MKYSRENAKKILAAGVALGVLTGIANIVQRQPVEHMELQRPEYGENSTEYEIEVNDGKNSIVIPLEVKPKQYSESEVEALFDDIENQIEDLIKGGNDSLERVCEPLKLIETVEGTGVEIQWFSSDYSLIDFDGAVYNSDFEDDEQKCCVLYAELGYMDCKRKIKLSVTVAAPERSEEEKYRIRVNKALEAAVVSDVQAEVIQLPDVIDGQEVTYSKLEQETSVMTFPILSAAAVAVLYLGSLSEAKRKRRDRTLQLQYDYSEVVSKLTLLVGAGMTFRKAWERIVIDYRNNKKEGKSRYVYEEMGNTLHELEAGVSEGVAYEQFGKRCDTKEYMKLASLLQQNLKKGARGMAEMLQEEAREAFEQRKNLAVKRGEEAGTQLLIPMGMMLIVVMIIIMVPALMSFQV